MGQAASAVDSVHLSRVGSKGRQLFGLVLLCSSVSVYASPAADSLHTRVDQLLAAGDTLLAIDILQDPAEHALDPSWTDALLDRLVLPDRSPKAPPSRSASRAPRSWLLRLDAAHVSDSAGGAYQTGSVLAEHGWRLSKGRHQLVTGLRLDGFRGNEATIGALVPRLAWILSLGRHETLTRAWLMLANDLDPDAGLDLAWRLHTQADWWIGSRVGLSLEGNQDALFGTGLDQQIGSWAWSSSLEIGGQHVRLPLITGNRTLAIDSLSLFYAHLPNGGDTLSTRDVPLRAWNDGDITERLSPYRLRLVGRAQLLWGSGLFRIGPGLGFEALTALEEDTWVPGMRSLWPDGTTFLEPTSTPGILIPISRNGDIYAQTTQKSGTFQELQLSPSLTTTIGRSEQPWAGWVSASWNLPFTSVESHPLADSRSGLEIRATSLLRW